MVEVRNVSISYHRYQPASYILLKEQKMHQTKNTCCDFVSVRKAKSNFECGNRSPSWLCCDRKTLTASGWLQVKNWNAHTYKDRYSMEDGMNILMYMCWLNTIVCWLNTIVCWCFKILSILRCVLKSQIILLLWSFSRHTSTHHVYNGYLCNVDINSFSETKRWWEIKMKSR